MLPLAAAALLAAADPAGDWVMDVLVLKNGRRLPGLCARDTPAGVHFLNVRRAPGRPTVVIAAVFDRAEVDRVERAGPDDRRKLEARLHDLDPTGEREQDRMGRLELGRAAWGGRPAAAWRYESDYFALTAPAPEEVARRAAVRLEQIFAAYAAYLPPRTAGGPPTEVVLLASADAYRKLLRAEGRPFLNPAFYDPAAHRIACGSDLEALAAEYAQLRGKHRAMHAAGVKEEAELRKRFGPRDLPRYLGPILEERRQIAQAERANEAVLRRAEGDLYRALYHEAFHAYAAAHVYPPAKGPLPRWLDEGLAQVFETAVVEAGELRVGHADRDRLDRARALLQRGELLPVAGVLADDPRRFLVAHAGDRFGSDRAYVTCWALALCLGFERHLLGTPALDRYVAALHAGADTRKAFEELTGQGVAAFERDFHRWLGRLQPDGSVAEVITGR